MADTIINDYDGTFKTEGSISLNDARIFMNNRVGVNIAESNNSLKNLFVVAASNSITLPNSNGAEPYKMSELYGMSYVNNTAPTISLSGNLSDGSIVTVQGGLQHTNGFASFDIQLFSNGSWQSMNNTTLLLFDSAASAQSYATANGDAINTGSTIIGPGTPNGSNPSFWIKDGNDLELHFNQTWSPAGGVFAGAHIQTISNYFTRSNTNFISPTFRWPGVLANFDSRIVEESPENSNCQWLYMVSNVGCGERIYYYEPGASASDQQQGDMTSNIHGRVYKKNSATQQWEMIDWWGWSSTPSSNPLNLSAYNKQYNGYSSGKYIDKIYKTSNSTASFKIIYNIVDSANASDSITLYINVE